MTLVLVWPAGSAPQERVAPLLDGGETEQAAAAKYVPDHLLVRFRPGTPRAWQEGAHAGLKAQMLRRYRSVENLALVRLPEGLTVEAAVKLYRRDPNVLYAEPDYIVYALPNNPNDPHYVDGSLWGLKNTGQDGGTNDADIDADLAWDLHTGSADVVVGVIDTGIDYNHEDLAANMHGLGCANGANGCFGIDTVNGDNDPMDDSEGHGTHVAGTIGAVGNNNKGVVGVNWTVGLLACKFLGASGSGPIAAAIACLDYLADLKQNQGVNLVATNNSWGGGGFSQSLFDAIDAHRQLGILFIAAAGNDGTDNDASPHFPSNYYLPNVISVAATDRTDARASFSDFGRRSVHLGAPGQSILSTTPNHTYNTFSGTSMATPHVTGAAALLKAENPARDWKAIKSLILAGGDSIPSMDGITVTGKRLNANGAMTCSNSVVASRLRPVQSNMAWVVGTPLPLAALHINCDLPNGNVDIIVNPGNTTVTLLDDGAGTDREAGDGIYSGTWTPADNQTYTLTFPGVDDVTVFFPTNYNWSFVPFNYRSVSGTNLNFGDDSVAQISPPLSIQFGGVDFSNLSISSNGLITFDGTVPFHNPNEAIPTSLFGTIVAPFWDDLFPVAGTNKNVFWVVTGASPSRELVVEWRGVRHFECRNDGTARIKFQAVFFENSPSILFNYADTVFGGGCSFADQGASATVGVQVGSSVGTQYSFDSPDLPAPMAQVWELANTDAPAPVLEALSPSSIGAGSPTFTLTVNGSGFTSDSVVQWNGSGRDTFFVSPSQLQATILAGDITSVGTADVTVFTPAPGGGTTAALPFSILPNSFFRGQVRNVNLVGIPGVTVTAFQSGVPMYSTTTNGKGRYALNVAAGTYDLVASKAGFFDKTRAGVTVAADATVGKQGFKLFRHSFFEGTVTSLSDGSPLNGATVEAVKKGIVRFSTTTAPDGTFSLQVRKGTYTLRASQTGFQTRKKKDQTIGDGTTRTGVNFALTPAP